MVDGMGMIMEGKPLSFEFLQTCDADMRASTFIQMGVVVMHIIAHSTRMFTQYHFTYVTFVYPQILIVIFHAIAL
jgi:hypothetical protein